VASQREIQAMRLAIALSARGLGSTSPNPPVGCVILDAEGAVVGAGYHERKGESHAEVHALAAAGERARGGTAVVTLEPCNHVGRTPACRQALLDAGVARVVIALIDPTSRGEGGAAVLRACGVDVEVGVLTQEAWLVLGDSLTTLTTGRPVVTLVQRLDGASVPETDVRELRLGFDAVLYADGRVEEAAANSHGHGILHLPTEPLVGDPADALKVLYAGGVRFLLLVGGSPLAERYLAAELVDRGVAFGADSDKGSRWFDAFGLAGFDITRIARRADGLCVEWQRATEG
jgi:diaminohydroxyphosphoribosylaminopyrimidine deaminase/5-amino-6-(5-phosphoribosylamino)uracil reductase